jgi:hypothetical protein
VSRIQDDDRCRAYDQRYRRPAIGIDTDEMVQSAAVQTWNFLWIENFNCEVCGECARIKSSMPQ